LYEKNPAEKEGEGLVVTWGGRNQEKEKGFGEALKISVYQI